MIIMWIKHNIPAVVGWAVSVAIFVAAGTSQVTTLTEGVRALGTAISRLENVVERGADSTTALAVKTAEIETRMAVVEAQVKALTAQSQADSKILSDLRPLVARLEAAVERIEPRRR